MRVALKTVNDRLANLGYTSQPEKGDDYFYFSGGKGSGLDGDVKGPLGEGALPNVCLSGGPYFSSVLVLPKRRDYAYARFVSGSPHSGTPRASWAVDPDRDSSGR